jgi:HAD superfamily hydrolase (TIGR01509 family)
VTGTPDPLQAVLFDMDGLLVDTEPLWYEVETEVMARFGAPWTPQDQAALLGGSLERSSRYLVATAGAELPWQTVAGWLLDGMSQRLRDGVEPRPGALDLLAELAGAGVPRALVSSSHRVLVDAVLASLGDHHFAFSVSADDVVRLKPDPEPYLSAVRRLRASPARCVVLEDSPTGVAAGEAAGCPVVAVPSLKAIPPAPGRTVTASLRDVDLARLRELVERDRPHLAARFPHREESVRPPEQTTGT